MFVGVDYILTEEDNLTIYGVRSKENEELHFDTKISINANPDIDKYLKLLEQGIQN